MTTTLVDLFESVRAHGVTLALNGNGITAINGQSLPPETLDVVRRNKALVIETLTLVGRLETGWDLCERAPPEDRDRLDGHWIGLLREYEDLMNQPLA